MVDPIPSTLVVPATKPPVNSRPLPELLWHVAPSGSSRKYPENTADNLPVRTPPSPLAARPFGGKENFELCSTRDPSNCVVTSGSSLSSVFSTSWRMSVVIAQSQYRFLFVQQSLRLSRRTSSSTPSPYSAPFCNSSSTAISSSVISSGSGTVSVPAVGAEPALPPPQPTIPRTSNRLNMTDFTPTLLNRKTKKGTPDCVSRRSPNLDSNVQQTHHSPIVSPSFFVPTDIQSPWSIFSETNRAEASPSNTCTPPVCAL